MELTQTCGRLMKTAPRLKDASASGNMTVLKSLLGPAWRGMIQQRGKSESSTRMSVEYGALFDWQYLRDRPALAKLYEAAKTSQWNGTADLDWSQQVDVDRVDLLLPESYFPVFGHACTKGMSDAQKVEQRRSYMSWLLSQFLHGEQGALFAACQVTEAVPWMDGKLYGRTQVMDEGRHVVVFHGYLTKKLEKK